MPTDPDNLANDHAAVSAETAHRVLKTISIFIMPVTAGRPRNKDALSEGRAQRQPAGPLVAS